MLYTLSHEISHYIREWNPGSFKELADFLIEQYGENGIDVEQLLEEQIGKLKEQYQAEDKKLPSEAKLRDEAYEELVADAMSEMLADDAAYEKLAKLKSQNKTLWEKIGEAIRAMLDKIKGALGIYKEADSALPAEARAVRELSSDVYTKLQDLYVKAFVEADDNYSSQNIGNEETRYSFRNSKSGMANDALLPYDNELAGYITQKGDYIVNSYEKLEKIVDLVFDNNKMKQTAYFGIIDTSILKKIENSIPNLPKVNNGSLFKMGKNYSVAATFDSIRHIVDEKNLSRSDVVDYLDRLADTILEFDSASFDYYYDKYGDKHDGILFKKKFSDEILISFDLVSNKKRSLMLQTLYMESGDYIKKKAAETLLMHNSLSRTPEVKAGQPSDYRISQKTDFVNSENQNSEKNFSTGSDTKNSARQTAMKEIRERLQANQVDTDKIIELADKYYKDTGGHMSKSRMRYKFLAIADQIMSDYDAAFEDIETLAEEIVNDPIPPSDIADTYNADDDYEFKVSSIANDLTEIIADSWKRGGLDFTELNLLKESDLQSDGKLGDRELLANALESAARSDSEKNMLSQYKKKIRRMSEEQKVLDNTKKVIKELSFQKGKRDTARIGTLKELVSKTENRINTYDRQLLRLESTSVLSEIIKRERQKAYEKANQVDTDNFEKTTIDRKAFFFQC